MTPMSRTESATSTATESFTIVGHRGAMAHTLENTLASFRQAEQMGCPELELDIRPTADGRIVVVHDATLDRLAADEPGQDLGDVSLMTFDELQQVRLRDGHRLHTLEEVCAATTVRLQVEIKDPAVVDLLPDFLQAHSQAEARIYLTSFSADALVRARELVPRLRRGMIVHGLPVEKEHPGGLEPLLERTGATSLHCGLTGLTAEVVAAQQTAGRSVHVWPVRSAEAMAEAVALGADGVTVDDPQAAFAWYDEALAQRG